MVRLFFCVHVGHTQAQTEVVKVFDDLQKTRGQRAVRVTSQVQIQGANVTFCQAHDLVEWRKPKWSPVDLIVPRKAAGSKFSHSALRWPVMIAILSEFCYSGHLCSCS